MNQKIWYKVIKKIKDNHLRQGFGGQRKAKDKSKDYGLLSEKSPPGRACPALREAGVGY